MTDKKLNGYELSRQWFDFVHETRERMTPTHTALYFWIIELNNRLQWKPVFGLPTDYSMRAIGVSTYRPYKKALDDLVRWGFVDLIRKSKNQFTCNEIALVLKAKAEQKQSKSTAGIVKQEKQEEKEKQEPEKIPAPSELDFIGRIITTFTEVFPDYEILTLGKERKMAGKLSGVWRKKHPGLSTDEILKSLREYFVQCHGITDEWHKNNMSLSMMVSRHNEINRLLKSGPKQKINPGSFDISKQDYSKKLSDGVNK